MHRMTGMIQSPCKLGFYGTGIYVFIYLSQVLLGNSRSIKRANKRENTVFMLSSMCYSQDLFYFVL